MCSWLLPIIFAVGIEEVDLDQIVDKLSKPLYKVFFKSL